MEMLPINITSIRNYFYTEAEPSYQIVYKINYSEKF